MSPLNTTGSVLNDGDSSWVFTSTVLTLLMTPALAFFYGGLVDKKNVLNTLTLSFICIGIITIQWFLVGYSFVFQEGTRGFGDFNDAALHNWLYAPSTHAPTIPNFAHMAFQCAFAIIAPALMSGAVVGRIKFKTYVCFILLWSTFVYDVIAHWIWSENGWLYHLNLVDYAGGMVVHLSSGVSALVATLFVGPRADVGRKHEKHVALTVLGAGLLWVGWHGFNGGSALAASGRAALALFNTNLAAAGGMLTWLALDSVVLALPAPRISSAALGFVVGLVGITPAAGHEHPGWALVTGVLTCACCWTVTELSRRWQWLDDTLDVFACHGVGGAVGSLLAGLFPQEHYGGVDGSFYGNRQLFAYQLLGVVVVAAYSIAATSLIFLLLRHTIGLRVSPQQESRGLDSAMHLENDKYTHAAVTGLRPGVLPQFSPDIADPASVSLVMSMHHNPPGGPGGSQPHHHPGSGAAAASSSSDGSRSANGYMYGVPSVGQHLRSMHMDSNVPASPVSAVTNLRSSMIHQTEIH